MKINLNLNMNHVYRTWTWTIHATNVKKGEHEFQFELENVYDSKLLLQPMWIWQTSWIRIVTWIWNWIWNFNIYTIVNYSCNQCGYNRQVESELLHECVTTRSPGGNCLQIMSFSLVVWGGLRWLPHNWKWQCQFRTNWEIK